jgi:hypothetical protein
VIPGVVESGSEYNGIEKIDVKLRGTVKFPNVTFPLLNFGS